MNKLETNKVLFIAPKYFDYYKTIIEELIIQKKEVVFIPEEEGYLRFDWVLTKISKSFKRYYLNRLFKKKISRLENGFDFIFVIRGRWLECKTINNLKINNPQAKFFMYQWDSIATNPNMVKIAKLFDKVFSFDYLDCEKNNNFRYLPLFFSSRKNDDLFSKDNIKYDLLFIGSNHSDRVKVIEKIKVGVNKSYNFKILIRITPLKYFRRKFIKKDILYLESDDFAFKRISYQENLSLISKSDAVLDVENPNQTGLTIRTFEVLAMGKKLVTTNYNIKREPFYDDRIIAVIDRQNPKIPDDFLRNKSEITIDFSNYSISNWVSKIF